ncbi:DNA alkylation repair protein [Spongiimicrobium sp. 3-5]|uniref:DNA alkylation repair protein n=1 Tax=Spongiimicrobium sp. 3-5 TaxID=3332596 RepID=UPI00398012AC
MAELLKNRYNGPFFERFLYSVRQVLPHFHEKSFLTDIYDEDWKYRELKPRMQHIAMVLKEYLGPDYKTNVNTILDIIQQLQVDGVKEDSFEYMFFPDFIERYGLEYYEVSVKALESVTQFTSCEFAVRPFIIKYEQRMMKQMLLWSKHKHASVRRLSSEGCRPRLPWAMALPALKEDPGPVLPILENLKNDESESVRRSVANNLNDISKDNPALAIKLIKKWEGKTAETDKLVKHAARTLLKQGEPELMELFGFGSLSKIKIDGFKVITPKVHIGESLQFDFDLHNTNGKETILRLEYGIYYQKANGSLSKKVFKISERAYPKESVTPITRKQPFKVISTRKFHVGKHQVSLIINGQELEKKDFELQQ